MSRPHRALPGVFLRARPGARGLRRRAPLAGVPAAALCLAVLAPTAMASNLTFTVNTSVDAKDAVKADGVCADSLGRCTLRAAIEEASAQPAGSSTTINVPAGTYKLTKGVLQVKKNAVTVLGAGPSATILSGLSKHQVITVAKGARATLRALTLTAGSGGKKEGGALANSGTTRLEEATVSSSTATQGGGIANAKGATLELLASSVSGNSTAEGVFTGPEHEQGGNGGAGGGIANAGTLLVSGGSVSANRSGNGARSIENPGGNGGGGGGIWSTGSATIVGASIASNGAGWGGLGYNEPSGQGGPGGGIFNDGGTLTVSGGSVTGNVSGGAGLELPDGGEAVPGGDGGGIDSTGTLHVNGTSFSSNTTGNGRFDHAGDGGGLASGGTLTVEGASFTANTTGTEYTTGAGGGGGIYNSGSATVSTSTFHANTTGAGGESEPGGGGAGLWNTGAITITASTFSENTPGPGGAGGARDPGPGAPGGPGGSGGAILSSAGSLTLTDSTLYGNNVGVGGAGGPDNGRPGGPGVAGGLLVEGGTAKLLWSTLDGNAGNIDAAAASTESNGTIVAASTNGPNCVGTLGESAGYNLDSDGSCGLALASDQNGVEPGLGPLANNGGPTETMAPLEGSHAIDAGGTSAAGCPATDQRGSARPDEPADEGACDVGAVEG